MIDLNTAIIGCGAIFGAHAEALAHMANAELVAVADNDRRKATAASLSYGCRGYTDYRELLRDDTIGVIHICTPHYLHAGMAIEAMKRGKHVLVEKPMAITLSDAEMMIRVSRETGMKLGVCFQNRYNTTSTRIKAILDSQTAGAVLRMKAAVKWHRDEAYYRTSGWRGTWEKEGGGVLINQAIHTLDLLQWFGGAIRAIRGRIATNGLRNVIEVEDTAEAVISFENGAVAEFFATNCHPVNAPVEMEIECEGLTLKLADQLRVETRDGRIVEQLTEEQTRTGGKAYWGCSHEALINDFYHCLASGDSFPLEGAAGFNGLKVVKAIYDSFCHQREVLWEEPIAEGEYSCPLPCSF